eukprot:14058657-Alexandrium_andersonii.AAC.1
MAGGTKASWRLIGRRAGRSKSNRAARCASELAPGAPAMASKRAFLAAASGQSKSMWPWVALGAPQTHCAVAWSPAQRRLSGVVSPRDWALRT